MGGVGPQALAYDRVSVDGNTLKLNGVYANDGTKNPYLTMTDNNTYVITNTDGKKFDTIEHTDKNGSGQFQFLMVDSGNSHYKILANTIKLESTYTDSAINNSGSGSVIDIGSQEEKIKDLNIKAGYGLGNVARVCISGYTSNAKVNFFVDNMTLELNKNYGGFNGKNPMALGIGYLAKNCDIKINATDKLVIVGDIGNGYYMHDGVDISNVNNLTFSENSSIKINSESDYSGTVQMTGNIYSFNIIKPLNNWEARDNYTYINFSGSESFFTGWVYDDIANWDGSTKLALHDKEGVHLKFDNGAQWNLTDNSQLAQLDAYNDAVVDFTYEESSVERNARAVANFKELKVLKDFNGDGAIVKMRIDGTKAYSEGNNADQLVVLGTHTGTTQLDITNIGNDYSKAVGTVLAKVGDEQGAFTVKDVEGALTWVKYDLDKEDGQSEHSANWYIGKAEKVTSPTKPSEPTNPGEPTEPSNPVKPTTSVSTLLSTVTAGYDTWRNDADKLNERMGELRLQGKGNEGLWARTKGSEFGRHGNHGAYTNRQHTYQLGYDVVTHQDETQTTYTGVAAEYGKGSASFEHGNGRMRNYGFGLYQTRIHESGHYLDLIYKFDKYKNDFHVADTVGNPISGKYGNNAMSFSAEYGRKNTLGHDWYVEPQGEVTLGYMWGNDFITSNHIHVEQKNMPALIGRLGVNVGRQVGDRFNFYVKASINHDFLGDYDVRMTDLSTGDRLAAKDSFGSSWFDYGTGFSVKATKDSYIFFDIERAVGGNYKKNWDWNAGVRWSF